ncbi:hypothetical protein JJB28_09735 [Campylobacter fetus subsp. venerealis]|uniref:hypothetical protein n=1 Tax=Campylobacter fetus TaxID=196 RepID=UPI00190BAC03|nr:hypothetical protein [Campylobacter fetus]MBK3505325.1 hypothetical protein [Campylobacter fetus subsp. venerealis]
MYSENSYNKYTERELRKKLSATENKEIKFENELIRIKTKFENETTKIKNQLEKIIQEKHLIKDAIMEKWRKPSDELLEAIKEVENGQTTKYNDIDTMMKDLRQ